MLSPRGERIAATVAFDWRRQTLHLPVWNRTRRSQHFVAILLQSINAQLSTASICRV